MVLIIIVFIRGARRKLVFWLLIWKVSTSRLNYLFGEPLTKMIKYLNSFLTKEGINIQNEYGNHASFVMFALGNELGGDLDVMKDLINTFRSIDDRRLYAFGSNNYLGFKGVFAR